MDVLSRKIFKTPFAVVDVETTGLEPARDRIVELGVVLVKPGQRKPVVTMDTLVDPDEPILNTEYHGISNEDVADAPRFEEIASIVVASLSNRVVVAHNARYDVGFLRHELERANYPGRLPYLCTLELDRLTTPEPKMGYSRSLRSLTARYGLPDFTEHRALEDAMASAYLLRHHLRELKKREITTFAELQGQDDVKLAFAESLKEHVAIPPLELGNPKLLSPREQRAPKRVSALAQYLDAVLVAMADLDIENDELRDVRNARQELKLSKEEVRAVHARVFQAILDRYAENRAIDLREVGNLKAAAEALRVLGWCPGDEKMSLGEERLTEERVELPAPDATPDFADDLLGRVFQQFLSDEQHRPDDEEARIHAFLRDVRRASTREEYLDVDTAEEIATSLLELIEHVRQGDRGHLDLLHAAVSYFVSDDDVVADFEAGGFDDDAEVVNVLADHFGRPDLRVELDFGF